MKIIFFITICFILTSSFGQSKKIDSTTNDLEIDYLKGLHKKTRSGKDTLALGTKISTEISPDIKFYTEIAAKLSPADFSPLTYSENNAFDLYVNDSNKLKAIVIRTATEKEKLMFKKMAALELSKSKLIGQFAKPFDVIGINGIRYELKQLKGKIIVLHFWMFDCLPCLESLIEINKIVEYYEGKEIIAFGVTLKNKAEINNFFYKSAFKFSIIPEGLDLINSYDIDLYPTHILIDKDSKITFFQEGLNSYTIYNLKKEIERLLKL